MRVFVSLKLLVMTLALTPPRHLPLRVEALATISGVQECNHQNLCCAFPSLTVLIPAYNEQDRILGTIQQYSEYLSERSQEQGGKHRVDKMTETEQHLRNRILVVDDGSTDETVSVVNSLNSRRNHVPMQCISLPENKGKGAAITRGIEEILETQDDSDGGCIILVADADGSGEISCLEQMLEVLLDLTQGDFTKPAMVVGNRGYKGTSLSRAITRWGFRTAVLLICGNLGVQDTQCGFKLMTASAGQLLYRDLHLTRWAHDVEVIFRAKLQEMPVGERVVSWQDKEGSKLEKEPGGTIGVSVVMLLGVLRMRLNYATGKWKLPHP